MRYFVGIECYVLLTADATVLTMDLRTIQIWQLGINAVLFLVSIYQGRIDCLPLIHSLLSEEYPSPDSAKRRLRKSITRIERVCLLFMLFPPAQCLILVAS